MELAPCRWECSRGRCVTVCICVQKQRALAQAPVCTCCSSSAGLSCSEGLPGVRTDPAAPAGHLPARAGPAPPWSAALLVPWTAVGAGSCLSTRSPGRSVSIRRGPALYRGVLAPLLQGCGAGCSVRPECKRCSSLVVLEERFLPCSRSDRCSRGRTGELLPLPVSGQEPRAR